MSGGPFGGARLDIELRRGARFYLELAYTDSTGAAPDLTGYSARMDVRARTDIAPASAGTPVLQLRTSPTAGQGTITLGGTVTVTLEDGTTGVARLITLDAGADLTAALAPTLGGAEHVYDLELYSGSSVVDVLVSGRATVLPEVTR